MRYIIFIFFLIFIRGNSQNLVEHKVDAFFKLNLPKENIEIDTLNFRMIVSVISNGKLIILKAPNNPEINIQNKKELISSYKAFQKGIIKKIKGEFIDEEIKKFNGILMDKMNFKSLENNITQEIESYAFYLENHYYNFQFWGPESSNVEYEKQKETILASISFEPKLTIKNQYTKK